MDIKATLAVLEDLEETDDDVVVQAGQAGLAASVFDACIDATESFEKENIGADLAYLLGAICKNSIVQWEKPDLPKLHSVLSEAFSRAHPVWTHIAVFEEPKEPWWEGEDTGPD